MSFVNGKVLVFTAGGTQVGDGAASVTGTTLETGSTASMYVGNGGTATDISVYAGGVMYVDNDGSASGVVLGGFGGDYSLIAGGSMIVSSGAIIDNVEVNGGLYSGGGIISGSTKNYGAVTGTSATMNISGATFKDNHAEDFNGYNAVGGGLEIYVGTLDIKDTVFTSNSAEDGFAADYKGAAGGAACAMYADVTMSKVEFTENKAFYGGAYQQQAGTLTLDDSEFMRNSGGSGGAMEFHNGATGSVNRTLFTSNTAERGGAIYNDTHIEYLYDSSWTQIIGSQVQICKLALNSNSYSGNTASIDGGAIYNFAEMTISGGTFTNNNAVENGGAVANATSNGKMTISGAAFTGNSAASGGAIFNGEGAVMTVQDIVCSTATDTIANAGTLTISGKNTFAGEVVNSGKIIIDAVNVDEAVISDFSKFSGSGTYSLIANLKENAGHYVIAGNASHIVLTDSMLGETENMTLRSSAILANDLYQSFGIDIDGNLILAANRYFSNCIEAAEDSFVEYSTDEDFSAVLRINADAVNTVNVEGTLFYRVVTNGIAGEIGTINNTLARTDADVIRSNGNGAGDVFFAKSVGVWSSFYQARNTITGDVASVAGKNMFTDVFAGSDTNILYLTDDSHGDALFLDDIYSDIADGLDVKSARVNRIAEIRAGAGNDVIDLTAENFSNSATDGLICRGGDGNDVIFAATGENKLFGDAGNDMICGASGNDLIVGGAGNDTLNGGGGDDIFAFGGNWGSDMIRQNNGTVTLWIEGGSNENWFEDTRTYTDGTNTIKVEGTATVTLKFEADPELSASGAFAETTTEKIFETDPAQGVIAAL